MVDSSFFLIFHYKRTGRKIHILDWTKHAQNDTADFVFPCKMVALAFGAFIAVAASA
jgi:hypothetical protein